MLSTYFLVEMNFYVVCPTHNLRIIDWNIAVVVTHEPFAFVVEFWGRQSSNDHTNSARDNLNSMLELKNNAGQEVESW